MEVSAIRDRSDEGFSLRKLASSPIFRCVFEIGKWGNNLMSIKINAADREVNLSLPSRKKWAALRTRISPFAPRFVDKDSMTINASWKAARENHFHLLFRNLQY